MLSIIMWSSVILCGSMAYGVLNNGEFCKTEKKVENNCQKTNYYDETYDYIKKLSYDEIEEYVESNYKLSEYKQYLKNNVNFDDKCQIARKISEIAVKECRNFNNKNSRY